MSKIKKRRRTTAKIRLWDDPILSTVCEAVEDGEDVEHIIRDMMYILTNSKTGVGLAANQAGHVKRIIIIATGGVFFTLINPQIKYETDELDAKKEGCLSYPGIFELIARSIGIGVSYEDVHGCTRRDNFTDFAARIIQHEIDHLNGKCKVKP